MNPQSASAIIRALREYRERAQEARFGCYQSDQCAFWVKSCYWCFLCRREIGWQRKLDAVGQAAGIVRGEVQPREGRGGGVSQRSQPRSFGQILQSLRLLEPVG